MKLYELLEQVTFQEDMKVAVSAVFNQGYDLKEVKALKGQFWGWGYEVTWLGKTENYDLVIHIKQ